MLPRRRVSTHARSWPGACLVRAARRGDATVLLSATGFLPCFPGSFTGESLQLRRTLAPATDSRIPGRPRYTISDDAESDSASDLEFTDELAHSTGAPPVAVIVVTGIERSNLTLEDGEIEVVAGIVNIVGALPALPFLRGDASGDGTVSGIGDGLFLLRYGFQEGPEPPCMDAADADDGGSVSGLSDGLFMLRWGFQEGAPPPEPGTEVCGTDPTDDDDVGCATATDICVD